MGYFYFIVNTCVSKWTRNGKLKLKLVRPQKKKRVYDAQTRKNANPALGGIVYFLSMCFYFRVMVGLTFFRGDVQTWFTKFTSVVGFKLCMSFALKEKSENMLIFGLGCSSSLKKLQINFAYSFQNRQPRRKFLVSKHLENKWTKEGHIKLN